MAEPRRLRLRITIEVDDEGGQSDYDQIMDALMSVGAEIISEETV